MTYKKIKLLIIDDEKDICKYEKQYFTKRNLDTYVAQTGLRALSLVKKTKPDLAVIDIHMTKGMGGLEILQRLLKIHPKCKCVMVTWDKEKALEAKKIGAVDFVIKPTEIKALERLVNKIVKRLRK